MGFSTQKSALLGASAKTAAGSIFSPPANWFHRHFNAGAEAALQLALRCGSHKFPLGIRVAAIRAGVYTSVKQGGTLIEYEDEVPEIRRTYRAELKRKGIAPDMKETIAGNPTESGAGV